MAPGEGSNPDRAASTFGLAAHCAHGTYSHFQRLRKARRGSVGDSSGYLGVRTVPAPFGPSCHGCFSCKFCVSVTVRALGECSTNQAILQPWTRAHGCSYQCFPFRNHGRPKLHLLLEISEVCDMQDF